MSASAPPDPNIGMPEIRIPANRPPSSPGQQHQQRRATRRRGKEREQDHQQPNSPAQQGGIRNERSPPLRTNDNNRFESRAKGEENSDEDEGQPNPSGQDGDALNQLPEGHHQVQSQDDDESPKGKEARPALVGLPKTPIPPAYRPYQQDAEKATREIEGDIVEALECLKCYAADPNEIRHALENWMNQVIGEFKKKKESIRLRLQKKWLMNQLKGKGPDMGHRQRELFESIQRLEEWRKTGLIKGVSALSQLCGEKEIALDKLQTGLGELIDSLLGTLADVKNIREYKVRPAHTRGSHSHASDEESNEGWLVKKDPDGEGDSIDTQHDYDDSGSSSSSSSGGGGTIAGESKKDLANAGSSRNTAEASKHSLQQLQVYLAKLKDLNSKKTYTIVLVGLEKAGKSSFINAILGAYVLPTSMGRCTMVHTEIHPSANNELEITVMFRNKRQFERAFSNFPREPGETVEDYETRRDRARRKCERYLGRPTMLTVANTKEEAQRLLAAGTETTDFLVSSELMYVVDKVIIGTNKIKGDVPWVIIDLPGWDSVLPEHRHTAIEAIAQADAFVVLRNGTKPDISDPEKDFLSYIRDAHYDAMSKAFGIITWLDRHEHVDNYKRALEMAINQFVYYGFSETNIFPACPIAELEGQPNLPDDVRNTLENPNWQEKYDTYPDLADGFANCMAAIKFCVTKELPIRRVKEAADIANQHVLPHVTDALQRGRAIIPDYIDAQQLNQVVESENNESWGGIFEGERFEPTLREVYRLKNTLIIKQCESLAEETTQMFHELLDENYPTLAHQGGLSLADRMIELKTNFQVHHFRIEDEVREALADDFSAMVDRVAFALAERLYDKYIVDLVRKLNLAVCKEEPYVFATELKLQQCQWEIRSLLRRVASPIIFATLRWPHTSEVPRKGAVDEFARVLPWVAGKIARSEDTTSVLPHLASVLLSFAPQPFGSVGASFASQVIGPLVGDKVGTDS